MNEIENDLKIKLKNILSDKFWIVKQFHPNSESDGIEIKILFEDIPGILVWDFFSPNLINELKIITQSPLEIKLVATGIDDVVWTYSIIKSK